MISGADTLELNANAANANNSADIPESAQHMDTDNSTEAENLNNGNTIRLTIFIQVT